MSQSRKKVLFVDDDPQFLDVVQQVMQQHAGEAWEIHTGSDAGKALAILKDHSIDLLVIDVHMPVLDGVQFLGLLHRKYPNMPKVVLTADASESFRAACLSSGAELFLEKPRDLEGWHSIYATLNELARLQPEEGFRGVLRRVGLQDVLQMECLARNSSVLEIAAPGARGAIYIASGQIVHSQVGERVGTEAFNQLLCLTGGQFSLKPFSEPPIRSIAGPWEFLIMEAARMRDETAPGPAGAETSGPVEVDFQAQLEQVFQPAPTPETAFSPAEEPEVTSGVRPSSGVETDERLESSQPSGALEQAEATAPEDGRTPLSTIEELVAPTEARSAPQSVFESERDRPQIDEVLVCSIHGDVLYEWQCANTGARIGFLEFLSQKARQLAQGLPLGQFDRLEMQEAASRAVAQIHSDRALFVRSSRVPAEAESAPARA
jgi:CheY-like chemotaxis protein